MEAGICNLEFRMRGDILRVSFGKSLALSILVCFFAGNYAAAAMVSFYVVEAGLPENVEIRHAEVWEDAFLDVFFDAGHIVSNAPILRLNSKPQGDILKTVASNVVDSRDGGIEYLLIAMLDYTPDLLSPGEITFYIYRNIPREQLLERVIPGKTYRSAKEELDDIKSIVRGLVPYINN